MEIGGRDVTFRWEMSDQRLKLVRAYIKVAWPESVITTDPVFSEDPAFDPLAKVPVLFFVHMDQNVFEKSEKLGVTAELEDFMVNVNVEEDAIHFVVGPEEGCPGEALMHGIIQTLQANRCYP
jgi:hypothetical protein